MLFIIANYANLASYPQLVINGEHSDPPHLSKAIDEEFRKQKSKYELAYKTLRYTKWACKLPWMEAIIGKYVESI